MSDVWKSAKVGLLVVLVLSVGYAVYRFVDEQSSGDRNYGVWVLFDDAQGLVPKSRVVIAGIQVGYIGDISLDGNVARVDIRLDEGVPVYEGATVAKRSASILGESILVIDPGLPAGEPLGDGSQLLSAESAPSTDAILQSVGKTADSVQKIAYQMEQVFGTDEGGRQMSEALSNLSQALEAINRTIQTNEEVVGRSLSNIEQTTEAAGPKLVRALENVEALTADVRSIIGTNRDGLTQAGSDVSASLSSINRASHQLEEVLGDIKTVTGRTARGEGTVGRLTSDSAIADEVQGVVEDVGSFVRPIARLQTIVGLRSEYNLLSASFKNFVSIQLKPREDRYYLIQLVDDPRGLTEVLQTTVRRSPPAEGEPSSYQETRIMTRDAFRFSLMFAKRIHAATIRFGIMESEGGVGLDLHLLRDKLEIQSDLFAFGQKAYPRLRTRLAMELVQRMWLIAGVDDTLNVASRDYFLGAMLQFNDKDLKSILPFAGAASLGQ